MRFSENEKKVINKLVEFDFEEKPSTIADFLSNTYFNNNKNFAIINIPDTKSDNSVFLYYNPEMKDIKHKLFEFLEIIILLKRLNEQDYITIIPMEFKIPILCYANSIIDMTRENVSNKSITFNNGDFINSEDCQWYDKNKKIKFYKMKIDNYSVPISKYICSTLIKRPDLSLLIKNNYEQEDLHLNKVVLLWTRIAAIITFVGLLLSLIISLINI